MAATLADLHEVAPGIHAMCRSRLGLDGDDVAQETLISLWLGLHRYDPGRGSFSAYATGIARYKIVDAYRRISADHSVLAGNGEEERHDRFVDAGELPEAIVVKSETAAWLRRLLGALPATQQQVLTARFFDDLSGLETAAAMGIPHGTVKSAGHNGLQRLRRMMTWGVLYPTPRPLVPERDDYETVVDAEEPATATSPPDRSSAVVVTGSHTR